VGLNIFRANGGPSTTKKSQVTKQSGSTGSLPSLTDVGRAYRSYFRRRETWNIGLIQQPITTLLTPDARPQVYWLPRVRGRSLADPFAVVRNEKVYVLCEELDFSAPKARIVYFELPKRGRRPEPKVAFEPSCHISYPYLFEYEGDIYCVPETCQAREVSLYKAVAFPHNWEKVETLLSDFAGVDPTVFQHGGRWWLTCGDEEQSHGWDKLFAWHAQEPRGPWIPHDHNPIKTDISSSRPAGAPFMRNGGLFRPAQDCSRTYGGRIVLNRILALTPSEFKEEPVSAIEPAPRGPYPDGLHTVSAAGDITLIDGKRFQRAPLTMLSRKVSQLLQANRRSIQR
jgi:hypothetical protein